MKKKARGVFEYQRDESDCGVACLSMVIKFYGGYAPIDFLRIKSGTSIDGTTLLGLLQASEATGLSADAFEGTVEALKSHTSPTILHILKHEKYNHYIVCFGWYNNQFIIADPEEGVKAVSDEFLEHIWKSRVLLTFSINHEFVKRKQLVSNRFNLIKDILKPNRHLLITSFILGLTITFLNLSTAIFIEKLIDILVPSKDNFKILIAVFSWTVILLLRSSLLFVREKILLELSCNVQSSFTSIYLRKIFNLPKSFFDGRKNGDLSARLNDTEKIHSTINDFFGQDIIDMLTLILAVVFVFMYNFSIGIFFLLLIPVYFLIIYYSKSRIYRENHITMNSYSLAESEYLDSLNGIATIKALDREAHFIKKVFREFKTYILNTNTLGRSIIYFKTVNETIGILAMSYILLFSITTVFNGQMELGDLVATITITGMVFSTITRLVVSASKLQETHVAFDRAYELISQENELTSVATDVNSCNEFNSITVKDLSFSFPGRENLFEGVNFVIRKGTLSLLIGHIGTGKTTLLQILQKFYYPSAGVILIDNIDFADIDIKIWRSQIGIVPQEIKIFNENLAFNICLSDDENEIKSVENFCIRYKFDTVFNLLPQQYDTMLGETGIKLSGGQKQILGLARALFKKPQFLLLDEPTSSLDPLTESFILALLTELKTEMGIMLITHNRSIELYADNVYVLKTNL